MRYYLTRRAVLKSLETPSLYHLAKDELYELDNGSFRFMQGCMTDDGCLSEDSGFIDYCMDEGLITTERSGPVRPPVLQAPSPSLRYLELQLTDSCNLRCKHCYLHQGMGSELSAPQVHGLLKEFEEMQGLRVLLSGGEPLMHGEWDRINEMLPDLFLRTVLFTNGLLLGKDTVRSLKVNEIQVSVDGLEKGHEALRGPGTFGRTMEGLRHALDAGFDVSISTMVHQANLSQFDAMERMFRNMDIKDWTVDVPCGIGVDDALRVSPETGGRYLGYGFGGGLHSSGQGYACGLHLLAVLADGKIAKCTFYGEQAIGSAEEGLKAAWSRTRPVLLKDLKCNCDFVEVCRGGCRYRAELLEGKGAKDKYRCMLYGLAERTKT